MNKGSTNFIIDVLMFLCTMALTGTGFVRKYVLLGGSASRAVYGRKVEMTLFGLTRDYWSSIHLWLGYLLLALLVLHIVLHWKPIKTMYRRLVKNSRSRLILAVVFIILSVLLALFPFIFRPAIPI